MKKQLLKLFLLLFVLGNVQCSDDGIDDSSNSGIPEPNPGELTEYLDLFMTRIRTENMKTISESTIKSNLDLFDATKGTFSDINYADKGKSNWQPSFHVERLLDFAYAYTDESSSYFGKDDLFAAIQKGYEYWLKADLKSDNWWYQSIGVPQRVTLALVYLREGKTQMPKDLETNLLQQLLRNEDKAYNFNKVTGANKTDMCLHRINNACLQEDERALNIALRAAFEPVEYTTGEGIRHDNSYFQHENQLYIGAYGDEFLKGVTLIAMYAMGTPYALPAEKTEILSKFMIDTYYNTIRGGYMPFSILGRSVSRKDGIRKSGTAVFAKRMAQVDPAHKAEFDLIAQRLESGNASLGVKASHTHYYVGDYTLHVRPKYTFDVRMVSKYTVRCETLNGENQKGYHLSDGSTNIMVNGDEYFNIFPTWNWTKVPGVTAPQQEAPAFSSKRERGDALFAGGASDGLYGVTGYMYFDRDYNVNTGANKSWYFFDDEVVCLGNVVSETDLEVQTTINQCFEAGSKITVNKGKSTKAVGKDSEELFKSPKWVHHNNVGYVFPKGGNVWVNNLPQRGTWKQINPTIADSTVITNDVFSLGLKYKSTANYTPYAYIVVPAVNSPAELEAVIQKDNIEIVKNTKYVQSVYHKGLKIWQTVFFRDNTCKHYGIEMTASEPCIVMLKETEAGKYTVYVADPKRSKKAITLTFKNSKGENKTIVANFAGTDVYVDAGKTKEFSLEITEVKEDGGDNTDGLNYGDMEITDDEDGFHSNDLPGLGDGGELIK